MLNDHRVQNRLTQRAAQVLSEKLDSRVSVESARFELFNRITLRNVLIEDRQENKLFVAGEISTRFNPFYFFQNRFVIKQLRIRDMSLYLEHDVDYGNNFDFFLELFHTDDENRNENIFYQFKTVQLINSSFTYTSNRQEPLTDRFDANNIRIENLNTRFSIDYFTNDSLSVRLSNMSFQEQSGLTVEALSAQIKGNNENLNINNLQLQLPNTNIQTNSVYFNYAKLRDGGNIIDDLYFRIGLKTSEISLNDFAAFSPLLKTLNSAFTLSGSVNGTMANIDCPYLFITYGRNSRLSGNFSFKGLPNLEQTYVFARVSNLHVIRSDFENLVADFRDSPFNLPPELRNIETLVFTGELSGFPYQELIANGNIRTNLGSISTNMELRSKGNDEGFTFGGELQTSQFRLGELLNSEDVGDISLNITLSGERERDKAPVFDIKGLIADFQFNEYTYKNIELDGRYNNSKFNGSILLDDENGKIQINGLLDFSEELPFYDFTAKVRNFQPGRMNLIDRYNDIVFSFNSNINIRGNRLDNIVGNLFIDNLFISNNGNELFVDKFELLSDISDELSSTIISSDFINGAIEGRYNLSTIVASVKYIASQYLPALNRGGIGILAPTTDTNFDFDLRITDFDAISNLLDLRWRTTSDINIFGYYDDQTRNFRIRGIIPFLEYNETMRFTNIDFVCENPGDAIEFGIDFRYERLDGRLASNFTLIASAANDTLMTLFQWENNGIVRYAGNLYAITYFTTNEERNLMTITDILPSEIVLADSLWYIGQSNIIGEQGRITIQNFELGSNGQNLNINGVASRESTDKVELKLQNLRLNMLEQFLVMGPVSLDGYITGTIEVGNIFDNPIIQSNIAVKDFSFNNSIWGNLDWELGWDTSSEIMSSQIIVVDEEDNLIVDMWGNIYPRNNIDLDLDIVIEDLTIAFLQPFLEDVLQNLEGMAYSDNLRMIGPLDQPLFEGDVFLRNAGFEIDFLGTGFTFSDSIAITPTTFAFRNVRISDSGNNTGRISGDITHSSYENFTFQINGTFNNIMALNTQPGDNEAFHGRAFGTGNIAIIGDNRNTRINIGVRTEPNTRIVIPFSASMTATDNNFITFIGRPVALPETEETIMERNQRRRERMLRQQQQARPTLIVDMQIDVNPNAEIVLITDPISGDMIRATGDGNIRIVYDELAGLTMYGNYILTSGAYNFTLQNIIIKEFRIREGSSITWSGSPYLPTINISAYYPVTASLLDLVNNPPSRTAQVHCILNLTGELTNPTISFDLEVPSGDHEIERIIRTAINTEEMMNRQMLYLLSMNRFFRPDHLRTTALGASEFSSLVSATVSAQLNHWLSQMNENLRMTVSYRGAEGDIMGREADVGIGAEMFNDRLILFGSVGYREDVVAVGGGNHFRGDFEIEYKLTRTGRLRAKAYSRSNDRIYLRNTTTQGVGIVYRQEFNRIGDLSRRYFGRIFGGNRNRQEAD